MILMTKRLREGNLVWQNICLNNLKEMILMVFFKDVAINFIDKTDGKEHQNRENYWIRTLTTLAPNRSILNTVSDQILHIQCIIM